ncbi:MAG: flagellar basal body-associated FliL family protein [Opitutae bacterium]|jgi:flagellar basal body-associated protein FliL|nr:flagellar basal body-associated FliL family protein [Opitutae bacterium]MBT5717024.1 flagellar basal body-associated FliL family protein [Opitutae bacterium]
MCAAQLDELPETDESPTPKAGGGGNLIPALIAIILAPALTVGAMFLLIKMNKPEETIKPQITEGGQPLDMEPSGEEKIYELSSLITNLGGPIKSRYINLDLKLEGQAGDFEKVLEMNEHRIRDKALAIMGGYTYEDAQLDGFQERVRVDLKKGFSSVLRKFRDGESDLIRQIYFTQFVVQ